MTNPKDIIEIYRQNLESDIIEYLASSLKIDLRDAMEKYYSSKLARQIESGENGIDNLDYKNLAEDLIETELMTKPSELH
ncbi:MAG: hypothetical protein MJ183_10490 [Treponemataceae bacterium]|nr:hypothetical protein [Treponemataceae bacterium]